MANCPSYVYTSLSSIEIKCHKGFHLKPKAAINCTEILLSVIKINIMWENMIED